MEQEACRSTSSPASRGWPDQLQSDWKIKLQKLQKALQGEFDKLMKAKHEAEKQAASLKKKQEDAHTSTSESRIYQTMQFIRSSVQRRS